MVCWQWERQVTNTGGDLRRFYNTQHQLYCGIDVQARRMSLCIVSHDGALLFHRNMQAAPAPFLKAVAPSRDGLGVAVACLFPWYGLADLCAVEGLPFVRGHALYMKAMHGGTAKNDTSASHKIAPLRRGGMVPKAYVYPAEMRATRDVLRRRTPLLRTRAELLAHVQHTNSQSTLPEIGTKIADKSHRDDVAERCDDPAVHKTLAVDLALITSYDQMLSDLELFILKTAKQHDAHTLSLVHTVPGIGNILRCVLLYDMHQSDRFPRVQACAS